MPNCIIIHWGYTLDSGGATVDEESYFPWNQVQKVNGYSWNAKLCIFLTLHGFARDLWNSFILIENASLCWKLDLQPGGVVFGYMVICWSNFDLSFNGSWLFDEGLACGGEEETWESKSEEELPVGQALISLVWDFCSFSPSCAVDILPALCNNMLLSFMRAVS